MRGWAAAAVAAGALAAPSAAQAVNVGVTGDDGVLQAFAGQTIRNMAPQIGIAPTPGAPESYVSVTATGPNGQAAIAPYSCYPISAASPRAVTYLGNGAYHVTVRGYATSPCTTAPVTAGEFTFAIGAGVALGVDPNSPLLTRQPGESATLEHRLPLTGNPGADAYDVFYSDNSALAPDGSLVGPSRRGFVDAATATVPLRFKKPGSYSVVARARTFGGGVSPWAPPVELRVFAPFDFSSSTFPDSHGPSYRLRVKVRERTARGRVYISAARGWTGRAHYRSLGRTSISRSGVFAKRFRLPRTGTYRIRYRFVGSRTTAPGIVTEKVRIRQR